MEATAPGGKLQLTRETILADYRLAVVSRQASVIGRKEVLTGKAKFGIFGDGKEVAQIAMAKAFQKGDLRSGYYRDQTFMFAMGISSVKEFFAQLYADPDPAHEPASRGRQMNSHFSTAMLDENGEWLDMTSLYNSSADLSPTGSQMPRLVGLAYASKLVRKLTGLTGMEKFSRGGQEIAFGTIGNASCAEGMFWEAINAVGVLGAPLLMSIWDDGYGISVPGHYQIAKDDLSAVLSGFRREPGGHGFDVVNVPGWDYPALCETYQRVAETVRRDHVPAIVHVIEMTQPQGHSTSGSHERYKSAERLAWEVEHDGISKMGEWMVESGVATKEELSRLDEEARVEVLALQVEAYEEFRAPIEVERRELMELLSALASAMPASDEIDKIIAALERQRIPYRRDLCALAGEAMIAARGVDVPQRGDLARWTTSLDAENRERYSANLFAIEPRSTLSVSGIAPIYSDDSPTKNGFEVMNACFDEALTRMPNLIAMGEDVGNIGDVNQGFAGLQKKFGELRVTDTGIRECTIIGQAIGMALRGFRPIAEIQYLDYLLYALQIMSDDLATLSYRTGGRQKCPVIVRTRGHRLEGIWHAGSQMSGVLNLVRGMHFCVPRNMTQASGFYNTLLAADDPGIVVEVLNGYRQKERVPDNIGEMRVPLGTVETLRPGNDVTLITYGACCRIALEAADQLETVGIDVEIIDVQTLLPFDRAGDIARSLEATNRIVFLDEDVPGGATAYMMQQVLEEQEGHHWLDSGPRTITASQHRPAYGSDGDYWSKPSREDVFRTVYELMHESDPARFPIFYR